jgi:hypothetical protein
LGVGFGIGADMLKAFFDIRYGETILTDNEGGNFADLTRAKREAAQSVHEMLAADITSMRPVKQRTIEITDETGNVLATVELRATIMLVEETTQNRHSDLCAKFCCLRKVRR